GLLERPRRPIGSAVIVVLGVVGALAAALRPNGGPLWALPTLLGAIVGVVTLRLLVEALYRGRHTSGSAPPADAAPSATNGPDRRRSPILAGSAVAGTAAAGATGVALGRRAADVVAERTGLRLPRVLPRQAAPAVPAGIVPDAPGVTPFLTGNS